jgi:nuclear pore complex protein Nup133
VAFVVFDRAVVVASMARQPDSPDSQLQTESHILPLTFEDVIDFREDTDVELVGSGMEESRGPSHGLDDAKRHHKAKYPATILIVRGGGVIRVAATDISKLTSSKPPQVTAKSKLEQAVFFGKLEQNPLSFAGRQELRFSSEETCAAALELSHEILSSATPLIPSVPASIDQNLRKRSAALHDLAEYLRSTDASLDRLTKWKLLWDAEKATAATAIWKIYDARIKDKPEGQKRGLLTEIVEFIHEDYKSEPVSDVGELDRVRHWFIKDIWRLEIAVPWAYQAVKYTYQGGQKTHEAVMQMTSEADDLVISALEGAFNFRTANMLLYGLQDEKLEYGVLKAGYEGLPEFWTSTYFITDNVRKLTDLARALAAEYWQKPAGEGQPDAAIVNKIRHENESLVDLSCRTTTERLRWASVQDDPQTQIHAEQLRTIQPHVQHAQIGQLTGIGLPDEAIALAEKHEALRTLAAILVDEINDEAHTIGTPGLSRDEFLTHGKRATTLHSYIKHYFAKFGTDWATALYKNYIDIGAVSNLLDDHEDHHAYLTSFLRSKQEYAKITWINEVTREKNFDRAAKTLLDLGLKREQDVWSKKIELSLGKLARLASRKYSQMNGIIIPDGGETELIATQNQLGLIKIQDQIYSHVLPSINAAIDENAELQLAMEAHGNKELKKQKAFSSLLEAGMAHLIKHEAMDALTLIDLLTLMSDNAKYEDQSPLGGQQFYLALKASKYGISDQGEQTLMQRVIWRRCLLRDNWTKINNTDLKADEQVSDQLRTTALCSTLRACFKNRIFEKPSNVKPINPEDVLGACTDELDQRFTGLDSSIREGIMNDMRIEDDALKQYIEACRLDKWYQGALDLAKADVKEETNAEAENGEKMRCIGKMLEAMEEKISQDQRKRVESLLHSKPRHDAKPRLNGSVGNLRGSIKAILSS